MKIAGSEEDTFIASSFDILVGTEFIDMLTNITCGVGGHDNLLVEGKIIKIPPLFAIVFPQPMSDLH